MDTTNKYNQNGTDTAQTGTPTTGTETMPTALGGLGKMLVFYIVLNRAFYLQVAGIFLTIILLATVPNCLLSDSAGYGYTTGLASVIGSVAAIYFSTCGAFIVSDLSHRHQRVAMFMLPASKMEKFLARYVHLMVLVPLAAFVGIGVGDILQMILSKATIGDYNSIIATCAGYMSFAGVEGPLNVIDPLVALIYFNSLFLAVGAIFRRHAWLKSNIFIFMGMIVLSIVAAFLMKSLLDMIYGYNGYEIELLASTPRSIVLCAISIVLAAFNYWFGYHIYSRMQVAANRWYNF